MPDIHLSSGKHRWPFSRGLVAESLMNAGLEEAQAVSVARRVESHLLERQQFELSPLELKKLVARYTQEIAGEELGQRFEGQTPAFSDIIVSQGTSRVPFSRGILSRSLESIGLSPRAAHDVAKEVDRRLRLRGVQALETAALELEVAEVLLGLEGAALREQYLGRYRLFQDIEVVEDGSKVASPFSKGILAQSLLAAGVAPADAQRLARETEAWLREQGRDTVRRSSLRQALEARVREELGDGLADRYHALQVLRRPERPLVILIGGVTGTGKSVLASEIAYRLGITRIVSSDSVREVMRAMVSEALLPTLHASTFTAWQSLLPPGSARQDAPAQTELLQGFREQVQQVSVGLTAVVERSIEEHASVVLEGVHVTPEYLMSLRMSSATLVSMLVAVPDEAEHRNHFLMRDHETQQNRPIERYLRYFTQIRQIQDHLLETARARNIPTLDGLSMERAAEQAVEVITRRVMHQKRLPSQPDEG